MALGNQALFVSVGETGLQFAVFFLGEVLNILVSAGFAARFWRADGPARRGQVPKATR